MAKSASNPNRDSQSLPGAERLQKVLAAAGIGSRRDCEELILEGRVTVDRVTITSLGHKVDPLRQKIEIDETPLPRPKRAYYLLNKPTGVVCTNHDPEGRLRVIDLIKSEHRIYPVGRLDRSSEGLILVTNDGELANQLTHPRYGVEKTYMASVVGAPSTEQLRELMRGIHLSDGFAKVTSAKIRRRKKRVTELQLVLREGKNREIRRLLARIGHKVIRLKRIKIGSISLGDLPTGAYRKLTQEELKIIRADIVASRKSAANADPIPPRRYSKTKQYKKPAKRTGSSGSRRGAARSESGQAKKPANNRGGKKNPRKGRR